MKQFSSTQQPTTILKTSLANIILMVFVLIMINGCVKNQPSNGHSVTVHAGESIQAAVDAASPGQTILIEPGTYLEAILVEKQNITLIGIKGPHDARVIIQNPGEEENGITVRDNGDGFVLKNVTIKDFEENGLFMVRVDGFELIKVETINNGEYGLFPVRCMNGLIEDCSASGHTDSGIYVGLSENIIVRKNVAFNNVIGIEIENCSELIVSHNDAYNNTAGMLIVLLPGLPVKTSDNIVVAENNVYDNNLPNFAPPGSGFEVVVPKGSGILIVGVDNTILKSNKISDNDFVGIAVVSTLILGSLSGLPPEAFADIEPNPDAVEVTNNHLSSNGSNPPATVPLPGVDLLWDNTGAGNCWKNNHYTSSFPASLPECL